MWASALLRFLLRLGSRSTRIFRRAIETVVFAPAALICRLAGYRFLNVNVTRIGHLCADVDSFVKERFLGDIEQFKAVILSPCSNVANRHIVKYFSPHIRFIESPFICSLLRPLSRHRISVFDVSRYSETRQASGAFEIQSRWGTREPLFSLSVEDRQRGADAVAKLGIPSGSWYVCVHSRESGYSGGKDFGQSFRNSDIESYSLAIDAIIAKGGWCVRMGDPTMRQCAPRPGLVDYAHSPMREDWLDVYLCATAKFFLGNTSGVFLMATIFGVRTAAANMVPLSAALPYGRDDIGIPKLVAKKGEVRPVKISEAFSSPVAVARVDEELEGLEHRVVDNTKEDIRDLAMEALSRVEGAFFDSPEDELLQSKFRQHLLPTHYSYPSESRIGTLFLRKYRDLL